MTAHLAQCQRRYRTRLPWVRTTPVRTVASDEFGCNGTTTVGLTLARSDLDFVRFNSAVDVVMAASVAGGALIKTVDWYGFVLSRCSGHSGYASELDVSAE